MLNYSNITTDDLMRLALEAKCHSRTVRRWVRERRIRFIRLSRRTVRFRITDIEDPMTNPAGQGGVQRENSGNDHTTRSTP